MDSTSPSLIVCDGRTLVLSTDHLLSMEPAGWQFYVKMAVSQKRRRRLSQQSQKEQQLKSCPLLTRQTALGRRFASPRELSCSQLTCSVSKAVLPSAWAQCAGLGCSLRLATFLLDVGGASPPGQTALKHRLRDISFPSAHSCLHILYNRFLLTQKSLSNTLTPSSIHIEV